ncbi:hypothetical protein ACFV24_31370 [Nocardia fluminea]|uniref:Dynamin family protein n=1 Tax=Nocardia fluminea TaxID=134984 RepID=A0A2N3VB51_9NOCA|nr:hypothetical protein [Nocardia fluminea]PKV78853.1 hypothetical protein ATK86_3236 [Nocardia fluminea]
MPTATEFAQTRPADQLDALISVLGAGRGGDPGIAEQLAAAAARRRRPLHIQITGRALSGRTTVMAALALLSAQETAPVDQPELPDPVLDGDLVIYVLAGAPQAADYRLLATLPPGRGVVVLNKADAVGARWGEAVAAAQRHAQELGLPIVPIVASVAAKTRAGAVSAEDLSDLRRLAVGPDVPSVLAADLFIGVGSDQEARRRLIANWDLYGVDCALSALRADPDLPASAIIQILHAASGIDPLHKLVHRRYEQVEAVRGGELLDELTRLAARAVPGDGGRARELIEHYLTGDEALWAGLCAGLACPQVSHLAAGYSAPAPGDADEALARATRWRAVVSSDMPPAARRAALRVHNGYVRAWERMSSAGL